MPRLCINCFQTIKEAKSIEFWNKKPEPNQFLPIWSETREHKLWHEKSARRFQVGMHFLPGHSQPDTFINSVCAMESEPFQQHWTNIVRLPVIHMRFVALHSNAKNWRYCPSSPEIADIRYCVITFHPRGRPIWSVKIYKDLYGYWRKQAIISLRHADRKNVQLDHDSLLYAEA